jgi:arsenite methyltransferase
MVSETAVRVYERSHAAGLVDDTIRPGGLGLTGALVDAAGLAPGDLVLDIGCGPAASVEHLRRDRGLEMIGLDRSPLLLEAARTNTNAPLVRADGDRLPFCRASLDAVLAECSLSLMADLEVTLAEIHRVLRPGGRLLVSDVYARDAAGAAELRALPFESCIRGALDRAHLLDLLVRHGFDLLHWQDHSATLRSFAAQLVWRGGSMRTFWCRAGGAGDPGAVETAVAGARPGYYVMVARSRPGKRTDRGGLE